MTPYEIVSRYFLPEIKALLALELLDKGFSQLRISRLLGVSQAMVNKYACHSREYFINKLEKIGFKRSEVESFVSTLVKALEIGDTTTFYLHVLTLVNRLLASGRFCRLHHKLNPYIPGECRVCYRVFYYTPGDPFLLEFMEALDRITRNPNLYRIVPEVGMNIVYSPADAGKPSEYIGLTGRILKSGDKTVVVGKPSRGGSHHVAQVLWLVKKVDSEKNVCTSIRYAKEIIDFLEKKKLNLLRTGPHRSPHDLMKDLEESILEAGLRSIDAIVDEGGQALEPIVYLFTCSLDDLVKLLEEILEAVG